MTCPTIAPQDVEAIAAQLAERGIHTLEAPMSGGPARAMDGSMGRDLNRTLDVVEQSSGQSWIGSDRIRRAIAGPLGASASAVFAAAVAAGLEGLDDAALLEFLQRPKMAP